jgi:hypothetical protein
MCAIIFKSESKLRNIPQHWISGIDIQKLKKTNLPDNDDEIVLMYVTEAENGAIGGSPVCFLQGIRIPCYCCPSPSASISSSLLTDMLPYMDSFNIFQREQGEKRYYYLMDITGKWTLSFWNILMPMNTCGMRTLAYHTVRVFAGCRFVQG